MIKNSAWRTEKTVGRTGRKTPAHQYNALFGGNPNLVAKVSDTYTVGVTLTPEFVPGKRFVSVDYFGIFVDDFIALPLAMTFSTSAFLQPMRSPAV